MGAGESKCLFELPILKRAQNLPWEALCRRIPFYKHGDGVASL